MLGSIGFGKIHDSCKYTVTLAVCYGSQMVAFVVLYAYIEHYEFSLGFASVMCFTWGVQEAGRNIFKYSCLGF